MPGWSMTPAFPRTGPPRRGWPGSTPARWARSPTARSASRCRRSPMPPPVRWIGGCSCPSAGTTAAPPRSRPRRRSGRGGARPASAGAGGIGGRGGRAPGWSLSRAGGGGAPPGGPGAGRGGGVGQGERGGRARDLLDGRAGRGLPPPVVVGDAGYGDAAEFRDELTARGWTYVVQVTGDQTAHPAQAVPEVRPYAGRGRRSLPRYRTTPVSLREHVLAAGRDAAVKLTWRQGSRGPLTSHFVALRVRPAGRRATARLAEDGSLPAVWLLAEWPPGAAEPTDIWLSTLGEDTPLAELVRLAKIGWRIEHDYRELKTGLGLDHFEGRTFIGWHRHVTLITAALLFLTGLRNDPKAAAPV